MRRPVVVAAFGAAALLMLVVGTIDTFVWLPSQLAPGFALEEIYAALDASRDLPYVIGNACVWAVFWSVMTAAYVLVLLPVPRRFRAGVSSMHPALAAALGLLLLGGIGFFHWFSAFGMGMSVSDELPPGVGGTTRLGLAFVGGGVLAGIAGTGLGLWTLIARPKVAPST